MTKNEWLKDELAYTRRILSNQIVDNRVEEYWKGRLAILELVRGEMMYLPDTEV